MSAFITQCPKCETSFNITQAQLKLAKGKVRCGFCLLTFSALEHQLFIEDEAQSDEELFKVIDKEPEREHVTPMDGYENIEEPASDQNLKSTPDEINEDFLEEKYDGPVSLTEPDSEEDDVLETLLLEHRETSHESAEASEELTEGFAKLHEDDITNDTQEDENETRAYETTEERIAGLEEDIKDEVDDDSKDLELSIGPLNYAARDEEEIKAAPNKEDKPNEPAAEEDYEDLYRDPEESSFIEDLSELTALEPDPDENLEEEPEEIEKKIEAVEETELTIKEQSLEIETSSITISSPKRLKGKDELQSLGMLYDDEALNKDGSIPVDSISEEPIAIYRQYIRPTSITLLLFFCNLLLMIALGAQYAWANFDTYLRESRFIGLTDFVCTYADCPDVRRFDLRLFSTDELIVNTHPSIPDALQIDFIFRNTADFEQAFPLVELNFSDLNRRLLANRLFKPEEYLDEDLKQFTHMPPNSSVQIRLEIADPGAEAINYSLTLRTP